MKPADKRLLEVGELIKQCLEAHKFHCKVIRPWNNEFEISLTKPGVFDVIQNEIKVILAQLDFKRVEWPKEKQNINDSVYSLYANIKENIGCIVDEERHHLSFFSEYRI